MLLETPGANAAAAEVRALRSACEGSGVIVFNLSSLGGEREARRGYARWVTVARGAAYHVAEALNVPAVTVMLG